MKLTIFKPKCCVWWHHVIYNNPGSFTKLLNNNKTESACDWHTSNTSTFRTTLSVMFGLNIPPTLCELLIGTESDESKHLFEVEKERSYTIAILRMLLYFVSVNVEPLRGKYAQPTNTL